MIRWNAGFIRGLAESVLARARVIRSSLTQYNASGTQDPAAKQRKRKKAAVKRARTPRRPNG